MRPYGSDSKHMKTIDLRNKTWRTNECSYRRPDHLPGLASVRVQSGKLANFYSPTDSRVEFRQGQGKKREASPGPKPTSLTRSFMTSLNRVAKGLWRVDDKFGLRFTCRKTKLTHVQQEGLTHPAGGLHLCYFATCMYLYIPVAVAVSMFVYIYTLIYAALSVWTLSCAGSHIHIHIHAHILFMYTALPVKHFHVQIYTCGSHSKTATMLSASCTWSYK